MKTQKKSRHFLRTLQTLSLILVLILALGTTTSAHTGINNISPSDTEEIIYANVNIDAPALGAWPDNTGTTSWDTYSIASISWEPTDSVFKPDTTYAVIINLEARDGYRFKSDIDARVNGADATVVSGAGSPEMRIAYTFPKTAAYDYITVTYDKTNVKAAPYEDVQLSLTTDLPQKLMVAKPRFQWYKTFSNDYGSGTAIPGATDDTYTANTGKGEHAFYYCVVTAEVNGNIVTSDSSDAGIILIDSMKDSYGVLPFTDVPDDAYYKDAVIWAVDNSITQGTSATTFNPNGICTRAQAVTFLWRANGYPAPTTTAMPFTDVPADSYYYKAVLWAVENEITNGTSSATFSPDNNCSRAQIVTMLWRAEGSDKATTANPFTDVTDDDYFLDAVLWAVAEGITNGTSTNTFSPDNDCTRAQIVTFIYRDMN